jgi:hypothetical protein
MQIEFGSQRLSGAQFLSAKPQARTGRTSEPHLHFQLMQQSHAGASPSTAVAPQSGNNARTRLIGADGERIAPREELLGLD